MDGSAPRQRGWFLPDPLPRRHGRVGPAPAGVVPGGRGARVGPGGRPRASGGGSPREHDLLRAPRVGPAPAGVVPVWSRVTSTSPRSAPRQRGWFGPDLPRRVRRGVGPAPAGVVPVGGPARRPYRSRPRASGGGSGLRPRVPARPGSAPRQRGWFYHLPDPQPVVRVGPAPAGVVHTRRLTMPPSQRRPRASGGGSLIRQHNLSLVKSAPRQRGWFDLVHDVDRDQLVGPAPAGWFSSRRPAPFRH